MECRNLDRCFSYLEELMIRLGPFDGLLGFSQVLDLPYRFRARWMITASPISIDG
jgi:hypothetical protein